MHYTGHMPSGKKRLDEALVNEVIFFYSARNLTVEKVMYVGQLRMEIRMTS